MSLGCWIEGERMRVSILPVTAHSQKEGRKIVLIRGEGGGNTRVQILSDHGLLQFYRLFFVEN